MAYASCGCCAPASDAAHNRSHQSGDTVIEHFADRLIKACRTKGAPVCVGIDPIYDRLPDALRKADPNSARQHVSAIAQYVEAVLQAVAPHVPCVKFQSACFERYLWPGVEALMKLIDRARKLGLIVINDVKRGDIGISSEHYAAGCLDFDTFNDLGNPAGPDALTIHSYLGADSIDPFIQRAQAAGKGLFALVRTSNPGGDAIQNLLLNDGRSIADAVALMVADLAGDPVLIGKNGYSLLGAVVGATKPKDAAHLRALMPNQIFLVPGFGAQGGKVDDVRACLKDDGTGAIITASRSVIYAYEQSDSRWQDPIERAATELKQQIQTVLP